MQNPEVEQDVKTDGHKPDDCRIDCQRAKKEPEHLFLRRIEVRLYQRVRRIKEYLVIVLVEPVTVSLYLVLFIVVPYKLLERFIGVLFLHPDKCFPVSLLKGNDNLVTRFDSVPRHFNIIAPDSLYVIACRSECLSGDGIRIYDARVKRYGCSKTELLFDLVPDEHHVIY